MYKKSNDEIHYKIYLCLNRFIDQVKPFQLNPNMALGYQECQLVEQIMIIGKELEMALQEYQVTAMQKNQEKKEKEKGKEKISFDELGFSEQSIQIFKKNNIKSDTIKYLSENDI